MNIRKRVGLWIRVSTDMQVESESPEHHEYRGRAYAELKGWEIVEQYRFDAVSGKTVMDLPEAKRMLQDIKSGHISGLIFSSLARLARNTRELLEFAEYFRKHDADLISIQENIDTSTPIGRFFFTLTAALVTFEREETAVRVAASVPIRAKLGKPLGGAAPFGYVWNENKFVIDPTEAPVRKLIYEYFLKFKRKKTVATELNAQGYRTRNGSKFSDTTVDRLLRDPSAKGQRIANHTRSLGKGKKWEEKPKEDWIIISCEQIVPDGLWDECNAILDQQSSKRQKTGPRPTYLLSGYVSCTCGKKMYVYHEKSSTYRCKPCRQSILSTDLDEIFHEQLKTFLLTDMDVSEYMEQTDGMLKEKEGLLDQVKAESSKVAKRMTELVNLKLDGDLSKESFVREHKPLEERYQQLEKQWPELEAEVTFLKIQHLSSNVVLDNAKSLYDRWTTLSFDEKRNIIDVITESIIVGKSDINISLSYQPTPSVSHSLPNGGNKQHSNMDS